MIDLFSLMRGTSWFRVAIPITSTTRPSETQWRTSYCLKLIRNHSTYYSKSRPHFNWNFMQLQILPFQLHLPPWIMIFQQEKPFKSRNQRICIWLSISSTFSSISHLVEYPGWVNFPCFRVASIHPFHGWIWEAACHCVRWCGESKDASGQTKTRNMRAWRLIFSATHVLKKDMTQVRLLWKNWGNAPWWPFVSWWLMFLSVFWVLEIRGMAVTWISVGFGGLEIATMLYLCNPV